MTEALALCAALLIGGADFIGGATSRRAPAARVAAAAQLVGLPLVVCLALLVGWEHVTGRDAAWSLASGLVVGVGLALFYAAMARGLISVVVPVAAVTGALVPVGFALAGGERPGIVVAAGIALAVIAIGLISFAQGSERTPGSPGLGLAVGAGVLFGLFFVFLSLTDPGAGLWPIALSRMGSLAALVVVAIVTTRGLNPGRHAYAAVTWIGLLEVVGATMLLLALQRGPVSVAAVLSSLYPVTTTFLAALVLRERLQPAQLVGVALALGAVTMISVG